MAQAVLAGMAPGETVRGAITATARRDAGVKACLPGKRHHARRDLAVVHKCLEIFRLRRPVEN
jgi:hypothetical protein